MSELLKVREVITLKGWLEGSGWSYSQVYSDKVIDITEGDLKSIDWDWYETDAENPPEDGEDTKIIVDLYAVDASIDEDKPLATHAKWASDLYKERYGISKGDFAEMIRDWQADHAPEYDDLEIDEPELDEDGDWVATAEDEKFVYTLSDDGTGNIVIHYIGSK